MAAAPPTLEQIIDEVTINGVAVPVSHVETSFGYANVAHKPADRDGAYIETPGREPTRVVLTCPFINGAFPGPNSTWTYGNLYPYQYDKVLAVLRTGKTIVLRHPRWGKFDVKFIDFKEEIDGNVQNGVYVTLTFLETIKPTFDAVAIPSDPSSTAQSYDEAIAQLPAAGLTLPEEPSFTEFINGLKGMIDGTALQVTQALAKANRVIYDIERLNASIDAAATNVAADVRSKGEKLYEQALQIRKNLNQTQLAKRKLYIVPRSTTMTGLTQRLGNDVKTLLKLNPELVSLRGPVIPQGTHIIYERLVG